MKQINLILFFSSLFLLSCGNANQKTAQEAAKTSFKSSAEKTDEVYKVDIDGLVKDFTTWYKYTYYNIRLVQDFIGQDENSKSIGKATFLHNLESGKFIAIRTEKQGNTPVYKLYKPANPDRGIETTMIQMAQTALTFAAMEGKELPDYHFTDLNGTVYDKNNTKGKVMLIKCWFIHCVACIKEFPALNRLVEDYKDRNDIEFVSLATDSKPQLIAFLQKKPFSYAVIPQMGNYMTNKLKVNGYPLHLLIDRNGKIVKVTDSIDDMIPFFEKEVDFANQ